MGRRSVSLTDEDISLLTELLMSRPDIRTRARVIVGKMERSRKRITVASAKEKGRALQDKVASEIAALLGVPFSKEDDALVSSRPMGQHGTDIILRGKAREVFPFSVECKSTEQFSLADAWDQAVANKAGGQHPMVVYKHKNINEPVVIVGWGCFLNIFSYVLFSGRSKDEQEESSKS